EAEHAVEREQPARGRLRGAPVFDFDAAQAVVAEEPAAVSWIERRDRFAAAAEERDELGAARDELHELPTGDIDADAVPFAARATAAALVTKSAFRPREVHALHPPSMAVTSGACRSTAASLRPRDRVANNRDRS